MLDTFARLLSSIPTFLFPVFASYKALKTSNPALLTPWLMYWVVLACTLFFESWTIFILLWIPFYSWIRLGFLLYLILPQTQGAKVLYQTHVHPFLEKNEHTIDELISLAHDRIKTAGYRYLRCVVKFIKENLLSFPPKDPTPPPTPTNLGYTQSLMARFNLPISRPVASGNPTGGATSSISEFYSLLASAVNTATSRDSLSKGLTPHLSPGTTSTERLSFISAQRKRLTILLSALEKEASELETDVDESLTSNHVPGTIFEESYSDSDEIREKGRNSISGLVKSQSEADFEKIEADLTVEELESSLKKAGISPKNGGWFPWNWRVQSEEAQVNTRLSYAETTEDEGKSTGVDL
ncbi:hypothetical protein Golomagni_01367 [Golovinomyces magnicellulatus]|nr:hypothetical protein Golomagni_01367 [Golovinomyces magnicellulatus]